MHASLEFPELNPLNEHISTILQPSCAGDVLATSVVGVTPVVCPASNIFDWEFDGSEESNVVGCTGLPDSDSDGQATID